MGVITWKYALCTVLLLSSTFHCFVLGGVHQHVPPRVPSPDLDENDSKLARRVNAGPHAPEQVRQGLLATFQ